jgi:hypothetical protein
MIEQPFLTLVSHLQRSNQPPPTEPQDGRQLDLFVAEGEALACFIVLDVVRSATEAGANLNSMKIQLAVNAARERAIALLQSVLSVSAPRGKAAESIRQNKQTMEKNK